MASLIYATPMSLDGYIAREEYEWSAPGDEELTLMTDVIRPIGTYLYGRRMYETMSVWETPEVISDLTPSMRRFAGVWQAAEKTVYSKTLSRTSSKRTRIEREFEPQAIRDLKAKATQTISIGGPNLAEQAIRYGLVDEFHFFVVPKWIGGGIPALPTKFTRDLDLLEERRFGQGWVYLRYRGATDG